MADKEFVLAYDAFNAKNLKALGAARERFRGSLNDYPLANYVESWWLSNNLAQTPVFSISAAADFSNFLSTNGDSVVADSVRKDWLRALGKQDRWDLFLPEFQRLNTEDSEISCQHWRYRLSQQDRAAHTEARALFNQASSVPDVCYEVFEKLRGDHQITQDAAWTRVRRLLEENLLGDARKSAALIDKLPANFERNTATVGLNPASYLERESPSLKSRSSTELFLFGINRLSRTEVAKAAAVLDSKSSSLTDADRKYAWGRVGIYAAMQHDSNALTYFDRAGDGALNETQLAWKARAAMRAANWEALRIVISTMPPQMQRESTWRYWLARAETERGEVAAATKLRETLIRENTFYGLLAAEEVGSSVLPDWKGWKPARTDVETVMRRPGVIRALTFYRLDMKTEGLREWLAAIRNMNDQELLAAAEIAREANIPDRAINTADRTIMVHDFSQRFPMPYRDDMQAQTKAQRLDESWVYGLIRQESRFMADAKSRVGASGLMQLMPKTAEWAARQVGLKPFSSQKISDVSVNITLGSYYLRHVLDDLGHPVLATAAYNAGPGRARKWRAEQALEGAIYAESIPFTETRDYVKKVMANAWFYAQQAGATHVSLKAMMGTVPGRGDNQTGASSLKLVAN